MSAEERSAVAVEAIDETNRLATTIAVVMTCHNRKDTTLASLAALYGSELPIGVGLRVILLDDGSTDGTPEAVRHHHPDVVLVHGDGNLYWNRGMHRAWQEAMSTSADYYLWLNDDTLLRPDAIERLLTTHHKVSLLSQHPALVVGNTQDKETGAHTYGGTRIRSRLRPMTHDLVAVSSVPVRCDTFNGNLVLVPSDVVAVLGNLEPSFVHAMGDTDYGLRAGVAGVDCWVMPGFAGTCSNNSKQNTFNDRTLTLAKRLKRMTQPKGLPPVPWLIMTRRHAGPLWPIYWAWPYLRVIGDSVFGRIGRAHRAGRARVQPDPRLRTS